MKMKMGKVTGSEGEALTHSNGKCSRLPCPERRHRSFVQIVFSRMFVKYTVFEDRNGGSLQCKGQACLLLIKRGRGGFSGLSKQWMSI